MANATQLIVIRSGAGSQLSGVGAERTDLFAGHRGCAGLSPGGVKQMVWLGGELLRRGIRPDVIYSSRLRRARQSATILGALVGRPVAPPSCLWCARHPGSLDGAMGVALGRRNDPRMPLGSGGERVVDVDERARRALDEISRLHRKQVVAVVTHLEVLRSLMALEIEEELGIFPDWSIAKGSYVRLVRGRTNWRRAH